MRKGANEVLHLDFQIQQLFMFGFGLNFGNLADVIDYRRRGAFAS